MLCTNLLRFLTTKRLENETVFLQSWFDSTLILVDQGNVSDLNWLGFAAPFEQHVWIAIIVTVLLSSAVMVLIESLENRRQGRKMHSWFSDHLYQTSLGFSQQFVYASPKSGAGRVFLASFAFWAMLIGATYTANLASLLVENALASPVTSVKGAMEAKLTICIHEGSASQTIMETLYPAFKEYPNLEKTSNTKDMYERLNAGKCEILVGTRQEFEIFRVQEKFGCNLVQAGEELHSGSASFAIEFDPLSCDSVLAYVLNIHLNEMSVDGNMTKFWNDYLSTRDGVCDGMLDEDRRRLAADGDEDLTSSMTNFYKESKNEVETVSYHRQLETTTRTSAGNGGGEDHEESLTITGMAGVFLVHGAGTTIAILLAIYSHIRRRSIIKGKKDHGKDLGTDKTFVKSEFEQKFEHLKAKMVADVIVQMDQFLEEHMASEDQNGSKIIARPIMRKPEEHYIPSTSTTVVQSSSPPASPQFRSRELSAYNVESGGNTVGNNENRISNASVYDALRGLDLNTLDESMRSDVDAFDESAPLTPPPPRSSRRSVLIPQGRLSERWH